MSYSEQDLKASLRASARWFMESGVMNPPDGGWGVAERVLLTNGNSAKNKVYEAFPAWTEFDGYSLIEQRRADCCMESAFMFLLMSRATDIPACRETAYRLLDFLYRRSGLLIRFKEPAGAWNWTHIKHERCLWFDDNSWMCALQLMIAGLAPDWDREFDMTGWALKLAGGLADGFERQFKREHVTEFTWLGNLNLPHWGSLTVMALARAWLVQPDECFRRVADAYHQYLLDAQDTLSASEYGYAVLGAAMAHRAWGDDLSRRTAAVFAGKLVNRMDPATGNIPAEHYEAPTGEHLADPIYTLNWAVLALQEMAAGGGEKYRAAFDKLLELLLKIQDDSPEKYLNGCWRGMFDLNAGVWGGGDCYEGGGNSIYTGWTNAPVAWAMTNALTGKSLLDY